MMAEGKQRHEWSIGASMMWAIATFGGMGTKKRYKPSDFNPFDQRKAKPIQAPITVLKQVFIDRQLPKEYMGG